MSAFRFLATATFILAVSGGAALADDSAVPSEPNPPVNPKIDVARGDRWTYEVRDDITDELKFIADYTVTDATGTEIDTRVRVTNPANNSETSNLQIFDQDWRVKDIGSAIYRPAGDETAKPQDLQVGKTWSYSFNFVKVNPPSSFKFAGTGKVESWERVSVGNGLAFDAFKIVMNSAVTPVVNNRKFETHVELWYAPAANRYVKRLFESRQNGKLYDANLEILRQYQRRSR